MKSIPTRKLEELPTEIISDNILKNLSEADQNNFRLTCKTLARIRDTQKSTRVKRDLSLLRTNIEWSFIRSTVLEDNGPNKYYIDNDFKISQFTIPFPIAFTIPVYRSGSFLIGSRQDTSTERTPTLRFRLMRIFVDGNSVDYGEVVIPNSRLAFPSYIKGLAAVELGDRTELFVELSESYRFLITLEGATWKVSQAGLRVSHFSALITPCTTAGCLLAVQSQDKSNIVMYNVSNPDVGVRTAYGTPTDCSKLTIHDVIGRYYAIQILPATRSRGKYLYESALEFVNTYVRLFAFVESNTVGLTDRSEEVMDVLRTAAQNADDEDAESEFLDVIMNKGHNWLLYALTAPVHFLKEYEHLKPMDQRCIEAKQDGFNPVTLKASFK